MNFRGCRKKPGPKCGKNQAARPLAGAEVLVAVRGPSPPSVGGRGKTRVDHDLPGPDRPDRLVGDDDALPLLGLQTQGEDLGAAHWARNEKSGRSKNKE